MGALPPNVSQEDYYNDNTLWGNYQFTSLQDIINNFQLMYMGDGMQIPSTMNRDIVIFHAKRGLQELNYDALRQIKGIELELNPDTLQITLPEDYIKYVRVSWVDDCGLFHPMVTNEDTKIAEAYLQDNDYNILFDMDGNVLKAAQNTYDQTLIKDNCKHYQYYAYNTGDGLYSHDYQYGNARYGLQTDLANYNGWVTVDKDTGVMKFSSNVEGRIIVLEYISDGLESSDLADIRIHKHAEAALYAYIEWQIVSRLSDMQEYVIRRKHKQYHIEAMKAKSRLTSLTFEDLFQVMRLRDKRIK